MSLHRLAEERSLAYHRRVASILREDPSHLERARSRLDEWIARGGRSTAYAEEWRRIIDLPIPAIVEILVDPGERATALRQASPFAGVLTPKERWTLWAEVRRRFEMDDSLHEDRT